MAQNSKLWMLFPEEVAVPIEYQEEGKYDVIEIWPNSSGLTGMPERVCQYVNEHYIVVQDRLPSCLGSDINKILRGNIESIIEGNGYSYEIHSRASRLMEFQPGFGLILKKQKQPSTCDLNNDLEKTVAITCVLSSISEALRKNMTITHRGVFYQHGEIFGNERVLKERINDVSCMLACKSSSLCLVPESKGSVFGPLVLKVKGGSADCSLFTGGTRIPSNLSELSFEHDAEFILVVEKKSFFHNLIQTELIKRYRVILVTGSGMPDIATRVFLRKLQIETKLQVYAIVDPDPYGVKILFNYAFGSVSKSYDNLGLALPSIMWIPITVRELMDEGIPDRWFTKITPSETQMMRNLLNDPNLEYLIPDSWRKTIGSMINSTKTSLDCLQTKGLSYAGNDFIPLKLEDRSRYRTSVTRALEKSLD